MTQEIEKSSRFSGGETSLPVVPIPIELSMQLNNIPEISPCSLCYDGIARRALISYEQPYVGQDGSRFVATAQVPGYKCGKCETEMYDLDAGIQALEAILDVVQEAKDEQTALMVESSLDASRRHREFFIPNQLQNH